MKLVSLGLALLGLAAVALAWTKEDHEIFDLVSALELAEGKGTTFYSFLNVTPSATVDHINKAYRKRSLALHPDKNRNVPDIQDRFARLGVITNILRNPEERKRYDHFYKNGIPRWRGTGYYYSRFRPSVVHVLTFLVFLSSVFHYIVLYMREKRDRARVEWFESRAREMAFPSLSSQRGNGSGTSTPRSSGVPVEKVEVVANVLEQIESSDAVDDSAENTESGQAPQLTRRQARSREGKKELAKGKQEKLPVKKAKAVVAAPEVSEKRRKVKVPYVEGGYSGGPGLDLVVTGDGDVYLPGDVSLKTQVRSAAISELWPVSVSRALFNRITGKKVEIDGEQIAVGESDDGVSDMVEGYSAEVDAPARKVKRSKEMRDKRLRK